MSGLMGACGKAGGVFWRIMSSEARDAANDPLSSGSHFVQLVRGGLAGENTCKTLFAEKIKTHSSSLADYDNSI